MNTDFHNVSLGCIAAGALLAQTNKFKQTGLLSMATGIAFLITDPHVLNVICDLDAVKNLIRDQFVTAPPEEVHTVMQIAASSTSVTDQTSNFIQDLTQEFAKRLKLQFFQNVGEQLKTSSVNPLDLHDASRLLLEDDLAMNCIGKQDDFCHSVLANAFPILLRTDSDAAVDLAKQCVGETDEGCQSLIGTVASALETRDLPFSTLATTLDITNKCLLQEDPACLSLLEDIPLSLLNQSPDYIRMGTVQTLFHSCLGETDVACQAIKKGLGGYLEGVSQIVEDGCRDSDGMSGTCTRVAMAIVELAKPCIGKSEAPCQTIIDKSIEILNKYPFTTPYIAELAPKV